MMPRVILATVFAVGVAGAASAFAAQPTTALDGYCPVCLVKMNKLVQGDERFSSVFDGKTYLFPGVEQKRMFDANPAAYVPAAGGDCVVCKVKKGKNVAGKPEFHVLHDGRLFLFPSDKQKRMFQENPQEYADADLAMDGNCPVCLVKSDKVKAGKPEYVSVSDGRRYLFPGPKEKRMFDADPSAFTPALGGKCTVCKVEKGKDVLGKAQFHLIYNKRLYLFPSPKQLDMFKANPDKYARADVALDGYCPVCRIDMGRDVKGKPELALDYKGKRYLFPAAKQRGIFLANPTKYAVE